MNDLASRMANRIQLTSDDHRAYLRAVEDAFAANVDYAMLVKLYGAPSGREDAHHLQSCRNVLVTMAAQSAAIQTPL